MVATFLFTPGLGGVEGTKTTYKPSAATWVCDPSMAS